MMEVTVRIFFLFQYLVAIKGREFIDQLVSILRMIPLSLSARTRNCYETSSISKCSRYDVVLFTRNIFVWYLHIIIEL
jgi:hypothetical protein